MEIYQKLLVNKLLLYSSSLAAVNYFSINFNFQSNVHHAFSKTRLHAQSTKNMDCPAIIILRDIAFFNCYQNVIDILKFSYSNCKTIFFTTIKLKGPICSFSSTILTTIYHFVIFQNYIPKSFFSGVSADALIMLTT